MDNLKKIENRMPLEIQIQKNLSPKFIHKKRTMENTKKIDTLLFDF